MKGSKARRWIIALALALSVLAIVQARHRVLQGRSAVLKWQPVAQALKSGEPIYDVEQEGYPTLPLTLLVLRPFHAAGDFAGPFSWALLEIAMAWWIVTRALALAAGRARDFPPLGVLIVLLLSFRVLLSDVLHGNINLLVGASVATAAWDWSREREFRSGVWLGIGAVLKVTPLLALVYFVWKRSLRGLGGMSMGILLGAVVLPGVMLGWTRNLGLAGEWWAQMIAPYLTGREISFTQSMNLNQSLLGLFARLLTDSVAIAARPPVFAEDLRINWIVLEAGTFRVVHVIACGAVLAWLLMHLRPRSERAGGLTTLGEFSMLALAMLFLSERSWKHHYVMIAFPIAFLSWNMIRASARSATRRIACVGLLAMLLFGGLTGSAVLGERGSDLAEAYGAYLLGGLALFVACGLCLRNPPPATDRKLRA